MPEGVGYGNPHNPGPEAGPEAAAGPTSLENMSAKELIMLAVNAAGMATNKVADEYAGSEKGPILQKTLEECAGALGEALHQIEMGETAAPEAAPAPTPPPAE